MKVTYVPSAVFAKPRTFQVLKQDKIYKFMAAAEGTEATFIIPSTGFSCIHNMLRNLYLHKR